MRDGVKEAIAAAIGALGLLAIGGVGAWEGQRQQAQRPPLFVGDPVSSLVALHRAAAAGERPLLAPKAVPGAFLDAGVNYTRSAPRLEPEATLVGGASLGTALRPLTLSHYERSDGTRFTLFVMHFDEHALPATAEQFDRGYLPIYHLVHDGVRLANWINPTGPKVRGGRPPTSWKTVAVGGPPPNDAFWDDVRRAQAR